MKIYSSNNFKNMSKRLVFTRNVFITQNFLIAFNISGNKIFIRRKFCGRITPISDYNRFKSFIAKILVPQAQFKIIM